MKARKKYILYPSIFIKLFLIETNAKIKILKKKFFNHVLNRSQRIFHQNIRDSTTQKLHLLSYWFAKV